MLHGQLRLAINGRMHCAPGNASLRISLAHYLRETAGLRACKIACNQGDCGSCTVVMDSQAVNACRIPLYRAHGSAVTTPEGLGWRGGDEDGSQCGFCAPGMMAALAAHGGMDGNLCRCGAYVTMRERLTGQVQAPAAVPVDAAELDFIPSSLEGALRFRAENPDCRVLAGATGMLDWEGYETVLSLHRIDELRFVTRSRRMLHFGALATWTMLFEAMPEWDWISRVGSRQIRNIATLGGNIAGAHPAADLLPVLRVLRAEIETRDGLVVGARLELPDEGERLFFEKVSRRRDSDIGRTIVAAVIGSSGEFRHEVGGRAPDHELARKLVEREAAPTRV